MDSQFLTTTSPEVLRIKNLALFIKMDENYKCEVGNLLRILRYLKIFVDFRIMITFCVVTCDVSVYNGKLIVMCLWYCLPSVSANIDN